MSFKFLSKEETLAKIQQDHNRKTNENLNKANRLLNNLQQQLYSALEKQLRVIDIMESELKLPGQIFVNDDILNIVVEQLNQAGYKASLKRISYEFEGSSQINLHIEL